MLMDGLLVWLFLGNIFAFLSETFASFIYRHAKLETESSYWLIELLYMHFIDRFVLQKL